MTSEVESEQLVAIDLLVSESHPNLRRCVGRQVTLPEFLFMYREQWLWLLLSHQSPTFDDKPHCNLQHLHRPHKACRASGAHCRLGKQQCSSEGPRLVLMKVIQDICHEAAWRQQPSVREGSCHSSFWTVECMIATLPRENPNLWNHQPGMLHLHASALHFEILNYFQRRKIRVCSSVQGRNFRLR